MHDMIHINDTLLYWRNFFLTTFQLFISRKSHVQSTDSL